MNGDNLQVQHGDKVVSLEQRLAEQDRDIARIQKVLLVGGILLTLHAFLPPETLFNFLLTWIGA